MCFRILVGISVCWDALSVSRFFDFLIYRQILQEPRKKIGQIVVCDLVISYYEVSIVIAIGWYFKVWSYINKKLIENLCLLLPDLLKLLFLEIFALSHFWKQLFFSISVILDFVRTLSVYKHFTSSKTFDFLWCHVH